MDTQVNYELIFKNNAAQVTAAVAKITGSVNQVTAAVTGMGTKFGSVLNSIQNSISTIKLNAVLDQINRVSTGFSSLAGPGLDLSTSMGELQAITGVAGDKLQLIEGYARETAKTFGISATNSVASFTTILSELSPVIANTPVALKSMGSSIATLSKQMKGDMTGAAGVLTTAMNQFQVSTDDPIAASRTMSDMMNVMSAAAAGGSATLDKIKGALEQVGMAAKGANISFEETNSVIQALDKAGKRSSEGGVAFRNLISIMEQGRFMPKETRDALTAAGVSISALGDHSKTFAERLSYLKPIMGDSALVTKLFGMENKNAAMAAVAAITSISSMTGDIHGTTDAMRQAAGVMATPAEKAARMKASIDDLKISLFEGSHGWLGYASVLGDTTRDLTNLWPAVAAVGKIVSTVTSATKMYEIGMKAGAVVAKLWTGAQAVLNVVIAAMPVIAIVAGIVALIATIGYVVYAFDGWGAAWGHLMDYLGASWSGFKESFSYVWLKVQDGFLSGIELIEKSWYHLKSLWDEDGAAAGLAKINLQQNDRGRAIAESYGKIAEYNQKADEAASKIFGKEGLHFNGKGVGDFANAIKGKIGLGASSGIADNAGIPGAAGSGAAMGKAGAGAAGAIGSGSKINQAIATGGTKNTTININIGKQIENINFTTANIQESAKKVRDIIVDELTRAVAMGSRMGAA